MINRTIKPVMKPRHKGYTLEIDISKLGYKNYMVECSYHFDKTREKYLLSMWIKRIDLEDRMILSSKKVDTQYISGNRETIEENICRVVHQACLSGYFDYFVERYEYELKAFERGNELYELERLNIANDNKGL